MKMSKRGISLIVLVITIVIMIILSGAVILRIMDEDITQSAKDVVSKSNIVTLKEEWNNYLANLKIDYASKHKKALQISELVMTKEEVNKALPMLEKLDLQNQFEVEGGSLVYLGYNEKVENLVKEVGDIKLTYTIEKSESKWNFPYVPDGYSIVVEDEKPLNDINEGFVIQCNKGTYSNGSQFVWVPVKSDAEYRRYFGGFTNAPTDYTDTEGEAQRKSIVDHGGFYIGRYECSATEYTFTNTWEYNYPASLKNKEVMTIKPYYNYGLGDIIARMAGKTTDNSKKNVQYPNLQLTLVTGYMWDITCKWLYDTNDTLKDITYFNGSKSNSMYDNIGYFTVGSYQLTGSNEKYKLNNIYDFSGNTEEITTELSSDNKHVIRGGGCNTANHKVSLLNRNTIAGNTNGYGFRIALYIPED